jgi:hypothetical protein
MSLMPSAPPESQVITAELEGNETEGPEPTLPAPHPAGRASTRPGSRVNPPHPPVPAGLNRPPARLPINHPPGRTGDNRSPARFQIKHPPGPAGL